MVRNSPTTKRMCEILMEQSALLKEQDKLILEMRDLLLNAPYEEEVHLPLIAEAIVKSQKGVVLKFPTYDDIPLNRA